MRRRILCRPRSRRGGVSAIRGLPLAAALPLVIPSGNLFVIVGGYVVILTVLVVFGIWGFRSGTGSSGGNGGGGSKEPKPDPPPPSGREPDDERGPVTLNVASMRDFHAWEEQLHETEHEVDAPDRSGKVPADGP